MEEIPVSYSVFLTQDASDDLEEIHQYIYTHDSPRNAAYVIGQIEKSLERLTLYPEQGAYPLELLEHGIKTYREIFFKPYRMVYRIQDGNVFVMMIVDGRRNLQPLLVRRLLK